MTNSSPEAWGREITQRAANEMKRLRGKKTVQWLSDRTAELGYPVGRSRLSDLERGDRGGEIKVSELLILAAALEVAPAQLLFPDLPDGPVEVIPGKLATSLSAVLWLSGESAGEYLPTSNGRALALSRLRENEHLMLRIAEKMLVTLQAKLAAAQSDAARARLTAENDEDSEVQLRDQILAMTEQQLAGQQQKVAENQQRISEINHQIEAEKTGTVR